MMRKRVVIVGAGPCGLVAIKEMLEAGHDVMLFERASSLGGVFASSTIYPNLHLTISNWAMAFSDFPDEARLHYPTAEHYLRYLKAYTTHFDLERHIQYETDVKNATLNTNGQWIVQTCNRKQRNEEHRFDALVVATGANQVPKPTPPGLSNFKGRIIHSSQYDKAFKHEVEDKKLRVLVVGGGESGADISAELSELSRHVAVWLRRPMCVGPRYLNDQSETKQMEMNKTQDLPANGFLEAATTSRLSAAQNVYTYGLFRRLLWHAPVLNETLSKMCLDSTKRAWVMNDQATYVTKNQRMCESIHNGKVELLVTPNISAAGRRIQFIMPDSTVEERDFDAVVLCTGFGTSFSWLKRDNLGNDPRSWWMHCFPPGLGDKLFFVGYARPHQGGIPVMAEMLSRYIAMLLDGKRKLPRDYAVLAEQDASAEREYYHVSPDLNSLVDYNAFLESVARRMGCEPQLPLACILAFNLHKLFVTTIMLSLPMPSLSPFNVWGMVAAYSLATATFFVLYSGLLIKWWFYPHWSVWYRQRGPGSDPRLLDSLLDRVNIWRSTAITRGFVLLLLWSIPSLYIQQLLSIPLFLIARILHLTGLRYGKKLGGLLKPKLFALHGTKWRLKDLFVP
jgi:dimethylaniline monooxygenase (N-oxide forming)